MLINVVGLGYIGLPTALMMSSSGLDVVATDNNEGHVSRLCHNELEFGEKGLDELFKKAVGSGIKFSVSCVQADMYIVAVPTPYAAEDKKIDPKYVEQAVNEVVAVAPRGAVIVIESTISPGTIDKYVRPLVTKAGFVIGRDIHLAHAPERIIPGNMIYELRHNPRTIGADDVAIGEKVKKIYSSFCGGEIVVTNIETAEMTKVVENTYRDINIAFANELAKICHVNGLDVYEIIRIANKHPRVDILQPGPGVGGHCISVDPWFLVGDYPATARLIRTAREINNSMPAYVLERIYNIMHENNITDVTRVGIYGFTYKENVNDVREPYAAIGTYSGEGLPL